MGSVRAGSAASVLVLAALLTAGAGARAEDVTGRVKMVDQAGKRLTVVDRKTNQEVTVMIGDSTQISSQQIKKLVLPRIKPGAIVTVRDAVVASKIDVRVESIGDIVKLDIRHHALTLQEEQTGRRVDTVLAGDVKVERVDGTEGSLEDLTPGSHVILVREYGTIVTQIDVEREAHTIVQEFLENVRHNLFKPLLLFFYLGFLVPILKVKFEFPYVIYQGLTIYLLLAIGWHGGEELSNLKSDELAGAAGFMVVGFLLNFVIGIVAYIGLSILTRMRRVDKATVVGYYGSDSAGTFVTCLGVLASAGIAYQAYMPVMLAVMEIPGCLVALYLVSRLRHQGMDARGNMPDEPGYDPSAAALPRVADDHGHGGHEELERSPAGGKPGSVFSPQLLHEVFLNPGLYLLFGGIIIGFISGKQGKEVTRADDNFFVDLFQGILCLFLLEMGMTASRKLKDLRTAGPGFVVFALGFPPLFAAAGILVAHAYSRLTHTPFDLGTYVLFSVLCAAASYIAVPAVQRLAIPEASPSLPLAASLGLTFTFNVTLGIPLYVEIAKAAMRYL